MDRAEYEVRKLAEQHRARREALEPFFKAKAQALSYMLPKIIVWADGRIEHQYTPEQQEILDKYDAVINSVIAALDGGNHREGP